MKCGIWGVSTCNVLQLSLIHSVSHGCTKNPNSNGSYCCIPMLKKHVGFSSIELSFCVQCWKRIPNEPSSPWWRWSVDFLPKPPSSQLQFVWHNAQTELFLHIFAHWPNWTESSSFLKVAFVRVSQISLGGVLDAHYSLSFLSAIFNDQALLPRVIPQRGPLFRSWEGHFTLQH